jgi:ABC-type antimicrobial peptide transport system permease subunit
LEPIPERPREHRKLSALTYREVRLTVDKTFVFIAGILSAVVGIVLLIAASNVASLLVTRTLARRKEIALRQSLGASRTRILRQLLTESLLLGGAGAVAGAIAAGWALKLLGGYQIPSPIPLTLDARVDARMLLFTILLGIATSVFFGLLPAIEAARTDLAGRIRQRRARHGMDVLVAAQVVGGVVLMSGAALFLAAAGRAAAVNPGFNPERALAVSVDPGLLSLPQARVAAFYFQLLDRVQTIPGVQSTALTQNIPLGNGIALTTVRLQGGGTPLQSRYNVIDRDFFPAIGTRILRGRPFFATDSVTSPSVAIINEYLAQKLFAGRDPIGERICIAASSLGCSQIVGVAEQGKYGTLAGRSLALSLDTFRAAVYECNDPASPGWWRSSKLFRRGPASGGRDRTRAADSGSQNTPGAYADSDAGTAATFLFLDCPQRDRAAALTGGNCRSDSLRGNEPDKRDRHTIGGWRQQG